MQGGCWQLNVSVDHDEAGHHERCACFGAPLLQPYGEALEISLEDYGITSRDQVLLGLDLCGARVWIRLRVLVLIVLISRTIGARYRGR